MFLSNSVDIDHLQVLVALTSSSSITSITTLAERMMHMSQRLTLTARRSSRLRGHPARIEIFGRFCENTLYSSFHEIGPGLISKAGSAKKLRFFVSSLMIFLNQNLDTRPELRSSVSSSIDYGVVQIFIESVCGQN